MLQQDSEKFTERRNLIQRHFSRKKSVNVPSLLPTIKEIEPKIIHSSWLTKHKKKSYLVITIDQKLCWFTDINTTAKNMVNLRDYRIVIDKKSTSFTIKSQNYEQSKDLTFKCESVDAKNEWKDIINSKLVALQDELQLLDQFIERKISEKSEKSGLSKWRSLYIKIGSAKDLKLRQLARAGDPYCNIILGHEVRRTLTVWGNHIDPVWDEGFKMEIDDSEKLALKIEVVDEDIISSDDMLGKLIIPIEEITSLTHNELVEKWYTLSKPSNHLVSGDIFLRISKNARDLQINLIEARNLSPKHTNGLSNPIVAFYYGKQKKKSKRVKNNLNPIFNYECKFKIEDDNQLHIVVWDVDPISKEFMGEVQINVNTLTDDDMSGKWYSLISTDDDESENDEYKSPRSLNNNNHHRNEENEYGKIRIGLKYSEQIILPSIAYDRLQNFLINRSNYDIVNHYSNCIPSKDEFPRILVNFYDTHSASLDILSSLINNEALSTPNEHVLFRQTTGLTKAIDHLMQESGFKYLQQVLAPYVVYVMKHYNRSSIEINPSKMEKTDNVCISTNISKLMSLCTLVIRSIFDSIHDLPLIIKLLMAKIRELIAIRFPNNNNNNENTVMYTSVTGFLFLRFYGPAILNPRLFGLLNEIPSKHATRAFTLVAKTIQNLANLVLFNDKEEFMTCLNPFISEYIPHLKTYIDQICSINTNNLKIKTGRFDLWREKELSAIHFYFDSFFIIYQQKYSDPRNHLLNDILKEINDIIHFTSVNPFSSNHDLVEYITELRNEKTHHQSSSINQPSKWVKYKHET